MADNKKTTTITICAFYSLECPLGAWLKSNRVNNIHYNVQQKRLCLVDEKPEQGFVYQMTHICNCGCRWKHKTR